LGSHEKKRRAKKKKLKEKHKKKKKKSATITVLGEKVTVKPPSETLLEGLDKKKQ
jgi:hypothetical protein